MAKRIRLNEDQNIENQGNESLEDLGRLITEAYNDMRRNAFKIGRWLLDARKKNPDIYLEGLLKEMNVPFGKRSAERYMAVARHPILSDATRESRLPESVITLAILATLPTPELQARIESGDISPETDRDDAVALVEEVKEQGVYDYERLVEAIYTLDKFKHNWEDAAKLAPNVIVPVLNGRHNIDLDDIKELSAWIGNLHFALEHELEQNPPSHIELPERRTH